MSTTTVTEPENYNIYEVYVKKLNMIYPAVGDMWLGVVTHNVCQYLSSFDYSELEDELASLLKDISVFVGVKEVSGTEETETLINRTKEAINLGYLLTDYIHTTHLYSKSRELDAPLDYVFKVGAHSYLVSDMPSPKIIAKQLCFYVRAFSIWGEDGYAGILAGEIQDMEIRKLVKYPSFTQENVSEEDAPIEVVKKFSDLKRYLNENIERVLAEEGW